MKVSVCKETNNYIWERQCDDIKYTKNNIKIKGEKTYYSLSFTFNF
jgi:hypothetical protein